MRLNAPISSRTLRGLAVVVIMLSGILLSATPLPGADPIQFVPPDRLYEPYKLPDNQPSEVRSSTQRLNKLPYEIASDVAAKAFMDELVRSICAMRKEGQVKSSSQTVVPQVKPILDELRYIAERTWDHLMGESGEVNESLSYLLFHSEQPSLTGIQNPFVRFTKEATLDIDGLPFPVSRELALAMKVNGAKDDSLSPGDVMKMALEVTGGDYPGATLLAHNFLKEITYSGRSRFESTFTTVPALSGFNEADKAANASRRKQYQTALRKKAPDFTVYPRENGVLTIGMETGAPSLAAKFRNMRVTGDPHGGDKMGPWYHSFGVLFLSTSAKGGRYTAETWANVEGLARHIPIFSSSPDYFKELFTNLAGEQSGAIIDCLEKEQEKDESSKEYDYTGKWVLIRSSNGKHMRLKPSCLFGKCEDKILVTGHVGGDDIEVDSISIGSSSAQMERSKGNDNATIKFRYTWDKPPQEVFVYGAWEGGGENRARTWKYREGPGSSFMLTTKIEDAGTAKINKDYPIDVFGYFGGIGTSASYYNEKEEVVDTYATYFSLGCTPEGKTSNHASISGSEFRGTYPQEGDFSKTKKTDAATCKISFGPGYGNYMLGFTFDFDGGWVRYLYKWEGKSKTN